jgi:hypothetical protein
VQRAVLQFGRGEVAERHPDTDAHRPADDATSAPGHAQPDTHTHDQRNAYGDYSPACDVRRGADVRPADRHKLAADIGRRDD